MRLLWMIRVTVLSGLMLAAQTANSQEAVRLVSQPGLSRVLSVALSPDGRLVLTGSMDTTARLWDRATGWQLRIFEGHAGWVNSVAFSPDGRHVLTGSEDTTARLWDTATGQTLRSFKGHTEAVTSVAFSPDGRYVLTGSRSFSETSEKTARLWDAATGQQIRSFEGHKRGLNSVAFSPDGRFVLTGSIDASSRLWDVATGLQLRSFEGHTDQVTSVAFSPDGRRVLTGSRDKTARLWDAATGQLLLSFKEHTEPVTSLAFSPDGHYALTGSDDSTARLWDVATGHQIRSLDVHKYGVDSVTFSPDGRFVLTAGAGTTLWNAATGQQIRSFEGHTTPLMSVAFSKDGHFLITGGDDKVARLWDAATGQQLRFFEGHRDIINSVAFSPDGHFVLTGSFDRTARLWDAATGAPIRSFEGHSNVVTCADFSPDGRFVLTGSTDHTARLWDTNTAEPLRSFAGHTFWVNAAAFSPDGRFLLTGGEDRTARLWDAATGEQIRSFEDRVDGVASVAFSPDGRFVLTGGRYDPMLQEELAIVDKAKGQATRPVDSRGAVQNAAWLWDAATGQPLRSFEGRGDWVMAVAFSPDGRFVLTGSGHTARLWDAATGQLIRSFEGHSDVVRSVTFSPDGRFILTGSGDTTARLWDPASGKELATLLSFEKGGWAVTDPEGRFDTSDLDGGAPLVWVAESEPMRPLPLEIFMRDYYTPRLLGRIMNGEKLPHVRSIAEIKNRVQPEVKLLSVAPLRKQPGRADVLVHAQSIRNERGQNSGLQDLRVFRNGQMVRYLEGPLKDGDYAIEGVRLPQGQKKATFTAYAFSSERIKSPTATFDYSYQPNAVAKPRAYLVQIGVNHYQADSCELQGAVNDAERLSTLLSERLKAHGYEVVSRLLISSREHPGATKDEVRHALAEIAAQVTPDDALFLSFSGHGYSSPEGKFYMLPSNIAGSCRHADADLLREAISADELSEWLRPIDAGEMTFVLDSCYSAQSVQANDFKPGPMGSPGLGQLAYDKRIRVLVASQSDATAAEDLQLRMGLLTYELTEQGLVKGKADWKPVDGRVTVGEWLSYAAKEVPLFFEEHGKEKGFMDRADQLQRRIQVPALFDFCKSDNVVLQ